MIKEWQRSQTESKGAGMVDEVIRGLVGPGQGGEFYFKCCAKSRKDFSREDNLAWA